MQVKKTALCAALMALVLTVACTSDEKKMEGYRKSFMAQTDYGLYDNQGALFAFDSSKHQIYLNISTKLFRLQNDAASEYLEFTFSNMPDGQTSTDISVKGNAISGFSTTLIDDARQVKAEGNKRWLWSDKSLRGAIIMVAGN